jgi:enkurin domain-containing protein 1
LLRDWSSRDLSRGYFLWRTKSGRKRKREIQRFFGLVVWQLGIIAITVSHKFIQYYYSLKTHTNTLTQKHTHTHTYIFYKFCTLTDFEIPSMSALALSDQRHPHGAQSRKQKREAEARFRQAHADSAASRKQAKKIAQRNSRSTSMGTALQRDANAQRSGSRKSKTAAAAGGSRDFHRDNMLRLRLMQEEFRMLKEHEDIDQEALWRTNNKYANVKSVVKRQLTEAEQVAQHQRTQCNKVAESRRQPRSRRQPSVSDSDKQSDSGFTRRRKLTKPPVPSRSTIEHDEAHTAMAERTKERQYHDFVRENHRSVKVIEDLARQQKEQNAARIARKQQEAKQRRGAVPSYLVKRKLELEQQKQARLEAERTKHLPKGMVLLSEEERTRTLSTLQRTQTTLLQKLQALPLVVEVLRMRRRKEQLESQLKEVEEAIAIFSRPKVYVAAE